MLRKKWLPVNLAEEFHPVPVPKHKRKKSTYTSELRELIKERDQVCQSCGGPGDEVHHVIPRGRFYRKWYTLDDVNDERNLMYLCWPCHHKATTDNAELERLIKLQEERFGPLRKQFE
ncbi:HNH endonuclease [Alicyclobacillus dauci]|uniref:HNH endonuclease n=1 Tax=Alicyclobacillus dauci TaxID=1475485 RepID=A0ABY6YXA5_9BACL|nr:HNH endonuclease [Alicyclobacillus dauci]WAH35004.1 HNH endonuclease [Alicyclobacillus dauci]